MDRTQTEVFARDGFADGGPILDSAACDRLGTALDRVIAERERPDLPQPLSCRHLGPDPTRPVWQVVDIWLACPAFAGLVRAPGLAACAGTLLGADAVRLWHDQIQYKPPGIGGENRWHQDAPYWPILRGDQQVTAWVALDEVDEDNGCMWMVPGSHRWGDCIRTLHQVEDFHQLPTSHAGQVVRAVPRPVRRGHVHWHHSLTWHGSPDNRSQRPRRAIAIHYIPADERYRAAGEHLCKRHVSAADGACIEGEIFPVLWQARPPLTSV